MAEVGGGLEKLILAPISMPQQVNGFHVVLIGPANAPRRPTPPIVPQQQTPPNVGLINSTNIINNNLQQAQIPNQQTQSQSEQSHDPRHHTQSSFPQDSKKKCISFLKTLMRMAKDKGDRGVMQELSDLVHGLLVSFKIYVKLFFLTIDYC